MTAKDLAEHLMKHPNAQVYTYGVRGALVENKVIFNGENWWIGE